MRRSALVCVLWAFLLSAGGPAGAWTPRTRVHMVDEAVRLMPGSLRIALQGHRERLMRGVLQPMVEEDGAGHKPPWAEGTLDVEIDARATALLEALSRRTPFGELAQDFGELAHYVLDAGFPPGMSDSDGARRYAHFSAFCESRYERFPLVFYGHEDEALDHDDYREFALNAMQRARREDAELSRAYAAAGDPPDAAAFDDRSIPFAVGSLSYSRTVNEIVRVWLSVWERAGGDVGRTPYRKVSRAPE